MDGMGRLQFETPKSLFKLSARLRLSLRGGGRRPFPRLNPTLHPFLKRLPDDGHERPWFVRAYHRPLRFGGQRRYFAADHPAERLARPIPRG